jgi:hypothetical protein
MLGASMIDHPPQILQEPYPPNTYALQFGAYYGNGNELE